MARRFEGTVEYMNTRFGAVETRFDGVDTRVEDINARFKALTWMIGHRVRRPHFADAFPREPSPASRDAPPAVTSASRPTTHLAHGGWCSYEIKNAHSRPSDSPSTPSSPPGSILHEPAQAAAPPLLRMTQLTASDFRATDCAAPAVVTTLLLPMRRPKTPACLALFPLARRTHGTTSQFDRYSNTERTRGINHAKWAHPVAGVRTAGSDDTTLLIRPTTMVDHRSLPTSWESVRVDAAGSVRLGRQRSPKSHTGRYSTKYLRSANITPNGLDLNDVREMDFTPHERVTFALLPGDILLVEASGSPTHVGRAAL